MTFCSASSSFNALVIHDEAKRMVLENVIFMLISFPFVPLVIKNYSVAHTSSYVGARGVKNIYWDGIFLAFSRLILGAEPMAFQK